MQKQTEELIASLESQNQILQEMIKYLEVDLAEEERRIMLRFL